MSVVIHAIKFTVGSNKIYTRTSFDCRYEVMYCAFNLVTPSDVPCGVDYDMDTQQCVCRNIKFSVLRNNIQVSSSVLPPLPYKLLFCEFYTSACRNILFRLTSLESYKTDIHLLVDVSISYTSFMIWVVTISLLSSIPSTNRSSCCVFS